MADTKISALPASTTPLAGTEVLPIVQGGVTKKVSVADLTAGRPVSVSNLTTSGTVTLNGGTANGVAYLNGSKVLTTGSALTFDGTSLGVNVASPGQLIDGSAANPRLRFTATSTGYAASQFVNTSGSSYFGRDNSAGSFFGIANGTVVYSSTNDPIGFFLGNNEQMRLTSTGLGIGTSSPSAKLDVSANAGIMGIFCSSGGLANDKRLTFTTGGDRVVIDASDNSTGAAAALVFATGGAEKLRLSGTGNFGLGGTSFGSGVTVFFLANATAPTTNPTGGGIMYVEGGALKYRGSSGTVTTIAAA